MTPQKSDNDVEPTARRNVIRRGAGLLLGASPVLLALASVLKNGGFAASSLAILYASVGALICLLNLWIIFGRRLRHGPGEMRYVSPVPIFGAIAFVAALSESFGSTVLAVVCLGGLMLDQGGLPWIIYYTWNDSSFWDR